MLNLDVRMQKKNLAEKAKNMIQNLQRLICVTTVDNSFDNPNSEESGCADELSCDQDIAMDDTVELDGESATTTPLCDAVTFHHLPDECIVKVFSYLTVEEKGMAERVCSRWKMLVRVPSLWHCIDLTRFPLNCRCASRSCMNAACYEAYKDRIEKFLNYIINIRPSLRKFCFAFDINDFQDDWLKLVRDFIDAVRMQKIQVSHLNWKETPVKPYSSESATWSSNNYNDLMYRHRRRQRHFSGFFDYFTASATSLSSLVLPFDWSPSSIRYLARLQNLECLVLESYFIPQSLQQETLNDLLRALPNIRRLTMTVCIGSGPGLLAYRLASKSLECLDLSQCQGFSLDEVFLPSLTEFRTSHRPYVCPLLEQTAITYSPCVYEVLRAGAPALALLNGHRLHSDWRENIYEDLEAVLKNICACPLHKPT